MHIGALGHSKQSKAIMDQLFGSADASNDQSLNVDEFKSLLDSAANPAAKKAAAAPSLDSIFATLDNNGDGGITVDELGKGMSGLRTRFQTMLATSDDSDNDATGTKAVGDVQRQRQAQWLRDAMGSQLNVNQQLSIAA